MLVLLLFALIAGAGTAITPCVLPGRARAACVRATGGRRRPIGIVVGLTVTFTIAIVLLAQLVKGIGLASGAPDPRDRGVDRVRCRTAQYPTSRPTWAPRCPAGPLWTQDAWRRYWSGLAVGGALGFGCAVRRPDPGSVTSVVPRAAPMRAS